MKKKPTLSSLENKLDRIFSEFIRRRHADEGGTASCVTCKVLKFWRDGHAGHFVKRQHRATRWRPTNAHFQCVSCNTYRGGMQDEYARFIVHTYGLAEFNDLMDAKHSVVKFTRADLEAMIADFAGRVRALDLRAAA